jgi:hypothetical protein
MENWERVTGRLGWDNFPKEVSTQTVSIVTTSAREVVLAYLLAARVAA